MVSAQVCLSTCLVCTLEPTDKPCAHKIGTGNVACKQERKITKKKVSVVVVEMACAGWPLQKSVKPSAMAEIRTAVRETVAPARAEL